MKLFRNVLEKIKARKIRKWATVYLSAAITILGVVHLFSLRYQLPSYIFDSILILLIFGLFGVIVISWFHGESGKQPLALKEVALYLLIIIVSISVLYKFVYLSILGTNYEIESNSIAVLPFSNLSGEQEDEYFSDGVTEDILTQLSKISGLKVISRTSVMKYKNVNKNIRDIAGELGVETILEGSVRRVDDNVRVVAQLIDAIDDSHIWSETYDRSMEDIFSIQSEIAEKIAATLQTKLLPVEKKRIAKEPVKNIEAYTFYLKGRYFYYNYTEEDNERAVDLFKKSLTLDSNYAPALAGLADAYNQKVIKYWKSEEWLDSALTLSKKAIKSNPDLSEAYKAIALTYDNLGEKELALSYYEKAIKLNPNYASAILNYGQIKNNLGIFDEALYWLRRAVQLEPDNVWAIMSIANVYKILRCDGLAVEWGNRALALNPDSPVINLFAGDIHLYAGNFDKSINLLKKSISLNDQMFLGWFFYSQIETVLGNYESAKKHLDSSFAISGSEPEYFSGFLLNHLGSPDSAGVILNDEEKDYLEYFEEYPDASVLQDYIGLAEIYAIQNNKKKAFDAWRKAIEEGWIDFKRVQLYPYFEYLRNDPEYDQLLSIMKIKVEAMRTSIREKYPNIAICE